MKHERKVKKSSLKKLARFVEKLEAFRVRTGEEYATLWENPFTCYALANVRIEDGFLLYEYDGIQEREDLFTYDEETGKYYENDGYYSVSDFVKFHSANLRRAVRYWEMDLEVLDAIQDGERADDEDDDNE